jgi:hypothetical protein
MAIYRTASTSKYSARLLNLVVIEETKNTRKVLIVELNDKKLAEIKRLELPSSIKGENLKRAGKILKA